MKMPTQIRPRIRSSRIRASEEGYILIAVMFMLAILMIALTLAVPIVKKEIQRDRDVETMHRGKQYVRAVKMYYKKFGSYPPNVDALVNTNQIRFLRKKYVDPTSGKADWKIIHYGENKTQTMGFFGQPIGGMPVAGTGPGSNGPSPSAGMFNSPGNSSSIFGSTGSGTNPTTPAGATGSPTDPSGGTGASGTVPTDPNAANGGGSTGTGLSGQAFGGGGMIGVSPTSTKQSILVYKKKNHYNEWEFFYDPLAEQMMLQGGNTGLSGQGAAGTGGAGTGSTGSVGTGSGSTGTGGSGNAPNPPSSPPETTPQQ
jgi:type II secretory pathway pseudopilin PulG